MRVPNIFKYATKELSQDALICWLVACAKESEGELRECGLAFVQALFDSGDRQIITKEGTTERYQCNGQVSNVLCDPKTQYGKIDVYFQARVDDRTVSFVVEDKTHSQMHGNQLKKYIRIVKGDQLKENFFKPVYFTTGYIFDNERERAEEAYYSVFGGCDMMNFLNEQQRGGELQRRVLHEFLRQYADHLEGKLNGRKEALDNWDLDKDFVQWEFMLALRKELEMIPAGWPAKHRNKGGSAWTQFPHWESRDFADTRFFVKVGGKDKWARHLFWRFDSNKPLRLMVAPHVVRKHTGEWTNEKWDRWSNAFAKAREKSGLPGPEKKLRRVRRRKKDFVREGLIGAVNVAGYLKENNRGNRVGRCVQRVAQLQGMFDKLIQYG